MAKTTPMKLVELMVYKDDIHKVLKYLGKFGDFQFQTDLSNAESSRENPDEVIFQKLQEVRSFLDLNDLEHYTKAPDIPTEEDREEAQKIYETVLELHNKENELQDQLKVVKNTYDEALAFSSLKVSYAELERLSFLTMRIGKLPPENVESVKAALGQRAVIASLGNDPSRVIIACAKNARFACDTELKKAEFIEMELPKDFKGIPDEVIENLKNEKELKSNQYKEIHDERLAYAETHKDKIYNLLEAFSVGSQIYEVENRLESTQFVYRITGWVPAYECTKLMHDLDELTENRTGFRDYLPDEVSTVQNGQEKVPVQLKHGKIVSNFERMIFSYGAPMYGTVDPTPFVAIFFTILFGIMFGDAGQGLFLLAIGILMALKKFKLMGWEKFGPVFICIGISSTIMGLLTGEFFTTEEVLKPFSLFVTGLFGEPREQILHLMPTGTKESVMNMFLFFGFTIGVGFIINTVGLIVNIINNFSLRRFGKALFGKNGISGAVFFWYVILLVLRVALLKTDIFVFDYVILIVSLTLTAFSEVLERLVDGERPVLENGILSAVIGAVVEIIEVISGYISNTVSFLRVGAFALSHAVLSYIIAMMMEQFPIAAIPICIVGNAIIIVLEGMIVAIQVVRLQYYEFFSKFFGETGREFKPFYFEYKGNKN